MTEVSEEKPIAALATSLGGAIAVVRVSGKGCLDLLLPFIPSLRDKDPHRVFHAKFYDPSEAEILDDPMVVFFRGPHSFTGEDSAEISFHAGSYIVHRALALLYGAGFSPAEAGEFTKRAYCRGKLDLTSAEGIRELSRATSRSQWANARQLASGRLKTLVLGLRESLIKSMAYLEARIDFPDEGDTGHVHLLDCKSLVERVDSDIDGLLATLQKGKIAKEGFSVALLGLPNAGKSTLMNFLLGEERALVSAEAGTTRDYIEESFLLEGRLFRLIDTAGIRESSNLVEKMGIEKGLELARKADFVLVLIPADDTSMDFSSLLAADFPPHAKILTKVDVDVAIQGSYDLRISVHTGEGTRELLKFLLSALDRELAPKNDALLISHPRHAHALREAKIHLGEFFTVLASGGYDEMLAYHLHEAMLSLGEIVGEIQNDDILDKIFSEFCVGK